MPEENKMQENDPDYIDDDPITEEEEKDLAISMEEFARGEYVRISGDVSDEEFLKILRRKDKD